MYFSLFAGVLCLSLFCYGLLCVHSSFAIILKRMRKLIALLLLSYRYYYKCSVALPQCAGGLVCSIRLWYFLMILTFWDIKEASQRLNRGTLYPLLSPCSAEENLPTWLKDCLLERKASTQKIMTKYTRARNMESLQHVIQSFTKILMGPRIYQKGLSRHKSPPLYLTTCIHICLNRKKVTAIHKRFIINKTYFF